MLTELKRGVLFTLVTMVLLGFGYHLLLWGFARVAFPTQAEGSMVRRNDGTIVGSRLIAQNFTRDEYFHPRPSAVDYNAASTGGSNYGPSNPDHLKAVQERVYAEVTKVLAMPETQTRLGAIGADLTPMTQAQFAQFHAAENKRYGDLIAKKNIKLD